MKLQWRFLIDNETLPKLNMAREEAILRTRQQGFAKDTLRIWQNSKSVVVGCSSASRSEVNLNLCWKKGIEVVRRTSGGGAVYHDLGNLNFSAVYDVSTSQIPSDILKIYKTFSKSVITGLSKSGVKSEFCPPNSILSHGKKVSGLAIHRLRDVCLIHGTLLVNADLQTLHQVLRHMKDDVVNVSEIYPQVAINEIKMTIAEGFRSSLGIDLENGELYEHEIRLANELYRTRYATDAWNLGT